MSVWWQLIQNFMNIQLQKTARPKPLTPLTPLGKATLKLPKLTGKGKTDITLQYPLCSMLDTLILQFLNCSFFPTLKCQ